MFGATSDVDTARAQFDDEKHIDGFQAERFDGEKVTSQHLMLRTYTTCFSVAGGEQAEHDDVSRADE